MKRNIFLLIVLIPFLFGCSVDYNLTITDNKFLEEISIYGYNDSDTLKKVDNNLNSIVVARKSELSDASSRDKIKGISYYNISKIEESDKLGLKYSFEFDEDTISDSRAINDCYKKFDVVEADNKITLSNKAGNSCFLNKDLEEININIKTNHKVKDNNADTVKDNIYSWNINKENYATKKIYIEFYTNEFVSPKKDYKKIIIYIIGIAFLSLIVIITLTLKSRKSNKF